MLMVRRFAMVITYCDEPIPSVVVNYAWGTESRLPII